jgi:hypothetical protein
MEAFYRRAKYTNSHALGIAHSTRREQHQSWLLPLHGYIDEPLSGLADFAQNFQGLSTHNKSMGDVNPSACSRHQDGR